MSRCACSFARRLWALATGSLRVLLVIGNVLVALVALGVGLTSLKLAYDGTLTHQPYVSLYLQLLAASLSSFIIAMLGLRAAHQPWLKFGLRSFSALTVANGLFVLMCIMWAISRGSIGRANKQLLADLDGARALYNWSGAEPFAGSWRVSSSFKSNATPSGAHLRREIEAVRPSDAPLAPKGANSTGSNSNSNSNGIDGRNGTNLDAMSSADDTYHLVKRLESLATTTTTTESWPLNELDTPAPADELARRRHGATLIGANNGVQLKRPNDTTIGKPVEQTNKDSEEATNSWDEVQSSLQCCGLKDFRDWNSFRPKNWPQNVYPNSCCSWRGNFTTVRVCQQGDKLFRVGCSQRVGQFESALLRCASLFLALQLILGAMACCVSPMGNYLEMAGRNTQHPFEANQDDPKKEQSLSGDFEKVYKPPSYDSLK